MTISRTTPDLVATAEAWRARAATTTHRLILCAGTGCISSGALAVRDALLQALEATGASAVISLADEPPPDSVHLSKSGCQGYCQMGPLLRIEPLGVLYAKVTPGDAMEIVTRTILGGETVSRLCISDTTGRPCAGPDEVPFYSAQTRVVLAGCTIEPEDLAEYIANDGYRGAEFAWKELTPEATCQMVTDSGLRGRGGGGFPTGRKWALTLVEEGPQKYVICNGDEGDPGAFMDRSVMEGNPHAVIEGMLIAGHAIGATAGVVYVRAEYPLAVERMRLAVAHAMEFGLLGDDVLGTGCRFHLDVMEGAGAFVCGEETALIASIEGERGMPRPKPPFPAQKGLYGKPTLINNVETLASVPVIFRDGPAAYRARGTENSPGTKTFALTGHVANTGLIEVPFGTTLRTIVMDIGGGVIDDAGNPTDACFKAVQIGGPSGGCLTEDMLDVPLDFDSLRALGAMVGSGGLVVMNQQTCMVQVARFFMEFTQNESCGKCVPCREGTKAMLGLLDDIIEKRATPETLELLQHTAECVGVGSLCGLGKTAPNPVLSTLRHFIDEYRAHVIDGICPSGRCKAYAKPEIDAGACKGCTRCIRECPVDAITGERKQPHVIDQDACVSCGACAAVCKFDAVTGL